MFFYSPKQVCLSWPRTYPGRQKHWKLPTVLLHVWEHPAVPRTHSSMSAGTHSKNCINMLLWKMSLVFTQTLGQLHVILFDYPFWVQEASQILRARVEIKKERWDELVFSFWLLPRNIQALLGAIKTTVPTWARVVVGIQGVTAITRAWVIPGLVDTQLLTHVTCRWLAFVTVWR